VQNNGRVVLITSSGMTHHAIANAIAGELNLVGILIHTSASSPLPDFLTFLIRYTFTMMRGLYKQLTGDTLATKVQKIETRLEKEATEYFQGNVNYNYTDWPSGTYLYTTQNINGADSIAQLKEWRPDIGLVFGSPIIGEALISIPRFGLLNFHSSLLPEYRGTRSEFWQVLNQRYDLCGSTVHFVDKGVDTGDIVLQRQQENAAGLDPYMLRVRNVLIAVELLPLAAKLVLSGNANAQVQSTSATPTFKSSDITLEKRVQVLRLLGHRI